MLEAQEPDGNAGGCASPPTVLRPAVKKPVLIVVHQIHSNPGHVGHWFRRNGYPLDIRRHFDGDPLPVTLQDHCGAVIFGGPQSANDALAHIRREVDWVGVALKEEKPFLGICLGAQMLAHYLGARVDHCQRGSVEIGYHELAATPEGRAIGGMPERAFQWHREGFDVPAGARLLAQGSQAYPNQAISYGPAAFGVQFHPEITYTQVNRWSGGNSVRLLLRGAKPRQQHLHDHLVHAPRVATWLDRFLSQWVGRQPVRFD